MEHSVASIERMSDERKSIMLSYILGAYPNVYAKAHAHLAKVITRDIANAKTEREKANG